MMQTWKRWMELMLISVQLLCITACSTPVDQFLQQVDQFEYREAKNIYYEDILGNHKNEVIVQEELIDRVENALEEYNNEIISDVDARNIIETVQKTDVMDSEVINGYIAELDTLFASKVACDTADTLYEQGDYLNAYLKYSEVILADTSYNHAVSHANSARELYIDDIIKQVDDECDVHNYLHALLQLNDTMEYFGENETLLSKTDQVLIEYENYVLDEAASIFNESKDYEQATSIIANARANMNTLNSDSPILSGAASFYESFFPQKLLYLDSYTNSGLKPSEWETTDKDNLGNTYSYGWKYSWSFDEDSEYTYLLNGEYDNLTGTFVCHYDSRNIRSQAGNIDNFHSEVYIYGDGKLLYQSPNMGYRVGPATFNLDISGVQELTIHLDFFASSMRRMQNGLVDVYIQKSTENASVPESYS